MENPGKSGRWQTPHWHERQGFVESQVQPWVNEDLAVRSYKWGWESWPGGGHLRNFRRAQFENQRIKRSLEEINAAVNHFCNKAFFPIPLHNPVLMWGSPICCYLFLSKKFCLLPGQHRCNLCSFWKLVQNCNCNPTYTKWKLKKLFSTLLVLSKLQSNLFVLLTITCWSPF